MEEPEPKTAAMGEGASLGGVTLKEGEAEEEEEEEEGSSNTSLSLNAELSSGSGRNPGQTGRTKRENIIPTFVGGLQTI